MKHCRNCRYCEYDARAINICGLLIRKCFWHEHHIYRGTSLRNGGRRAGIGTLYDDYGEESMNYHDYGGVRVKLPHDDVKPEELNGPVRIYKEADHA